MKLQIIYKPHQFLGIILAILLLNPKLFSHSYDFHYNNAKIPLEKAFSVISEKFDVYFNYDRSVVKDIEVEFEMDQDASLTQILDQLLSHTDLSFEIFDNRYVAIFKNSKQGMHSLKKMIQFFQEIIQRNEEKSKNQYEVAPLNSSPMHSIKKFKFESIRGLVTDADGLPLIGVTIVVLGTNKATTTDSDGRFLVDANVGDKIEFRYLGMSTKVIQLKDRNDLSIVMEYEATTLSGIEVVGIRASQLRAAKVKREAATVIEAITPEDIGNFSDESVVDALERVPGLQVERDLGGNEGDRVSIRGIGPQFVTVSINGRTPLSAGSEGRANFRSFNLGVIPTEIISGALIYKGAEARNIENGLGGSTDFQIIKPLELKYGKNANNQPKKNYFILNARNTYDAAIEDFTFQPRLSAAYGYKFSDKLGIFVTGLYSDTKRSRDEAFVRGTYRTIREDTNRDGVFDANAGDKTYEDVFTANNIKYNPIRENLYRNAASAIIQWKVNNDLEINLDYLFSSYDNQSLRDGTFVLLTPGGARNGFYHGSNFLQPGSFIIEDNYLRYADMSGSAKSDITWRTAALRFDNKTTNQIGGLNLKWEKNNWKIAADASLSDLKFNQVLQNAGNRAISGLDQSKIVVDLGQDAQYVTFGDDVFENAQYTYTPQALILLRQTTGYNSAYKLDFQRTVNKNLNFEFGSRYSKISLDTRQARANVSYSEERIQQIANLFEDAPLVNPFMSSYNIGHNRWYTTPYEEIFKFDEIYKADAGSAFEDDLNAITDGTIPLDRANTFISEENTLAFYGQINFKIPKLFNALPVSGNIGLRAVQTELISHSFTQTTLRDPHLDEESLGDFIPGITDQSGWSYLPSLNLKANLAKNFIYRISISKSLTRANFEDLAPRSNIIALDPNSALVNPSSPEYVGDGGLGTDLAFTGNINSGNPLLNPYEAWSFDNTIELYSDFGSSFVISGYYKSISNFILSQSFSEQAAPTENEIGISLPTYGAAGALRYDITKPVNFSDAKVYGFEIGVNQHFNNLPGLWNGFGIQANYNWVSSDFDKDVGDANNGFPGSSKNNFNAILYYEKYGLGIRLTLASRSDFLQNLGTPGNDRRSLTVFREGSTIYGARINYNFNKNLGINISGQNLLGTDARDFLPNSRKNFYRIVTLSPVYTFGLRYKI